MVEKDHMTFEVKSGFKACSDPKFQEHFFRGYDYTYISTCVSFPRLTQTEIRSSRRLLSHLEGLKHRSSEIGIRRNSTS
jgi:hypothetical protein